MKSKQYDLNSTGASCFILKRYFKFVPFFNSSPDRLASDSFGELSRFRKFSLLTIVVAWIVCIETTELIFGKHTNFKGTAVQDKFN